MDGKKKSKQPLTNGSTQNYFFDKFFSSATKHKKKDLFTGISKMSNSLCLEQRNIFSCQSYICASQSVQFLPSSSLHPPLQAVQAVEQRVQQDCHSPLVTVQLQLCQCCIKASRTSAGSLPITLRFASLPPEKPPDRKLTEGCLEQSLSVVQPSILRQFLSCPQCSLPDCGQQLGQSSDSPLSCAEKADHKDFECNNE